MRNLLNDIEIANVSAPVAAGSAIDQNTSIIDMQNFEGCIFIAPVTDSVAAGVATLAIEQNDVESDVGMKALMEAEAMLTSVVDDDLNDKFIVIDIYKPKKRYIQGVLTSTNANIAFGNVTAIKYSGRKSPVIQSDSVQVSKVLASPEEVV